MLKAVFLDIDNAVLDFDKCADASMKRAAYLTGLPYEPRRSDTFTRINDSTDALPLFFKKGLTVKRVYGLSYHRGRRK